METVKAMMIERCTATGHTTIQKQIETLTLDASKIKNVASNTPARSFSDIVRRRYTAWASKAK